MDPLTLIDAWDVPFAAAAVVGPEGVVAVRGDASRVVRVASISKTMLAYATLVAVEDGTLDLDEPAGPPGSTLRHLLAHASGLPFEGPDPIAPPGRRRIYSNSGIEEAARLLEAASGFDVGDYLREALFEPLGMRVTMLRGSPAHGVHANLADLVRYATELLRPTLLAPETVAQATSVQLGPLAGVLPGIGLFERNDWGLGFELRGDKQPHWTGARNSARTFGHFGGSGTCLWVDPDRSLALAVLTTREFGPWALEAWPALSDAVLAGAI